MILFVFLFFKSTDAQIGLTTYFDLGENNVSEGLYLKSAVLGSYPVKQMRIEGGMQYDLISAGSHFLSGVSLIVGKEMVIKNIQFEVLGLYMNNFFSGLAHESNWGALMNYEQNHFSGKLGTGFKTYEITPKARKRYDIESNTSIHENWNLMYLLQYNLNPKNSKWDLSAAITNIDHFLINQETNPMFNLCGGYNYSRSLSLFIESWYKNAGVLNISANYFGFFFRTGLKWEFH